MLKILNKTVEVTGLIDYLEKKLTNSNEKYCWCVKEIASTQEEPVFTMELSTLSRYLNLNLNITKLEIEANGQVNNSPYFSLNEALDLMFRVKKHFTPSLDNPAAGGYTYFEAQSEENSKKYYECLAAHFIDSCKDVAPSRLKIK